MVQYGTNYFDAYTVNLWEREREREREREQILWIRFIIHYTIEIMVGAKFEQEVTFR